MRGGNVVWPDVSLICNCVVAAHCCSCSKAYFCYAPLLFVAVLKVAYSETPFLSHTHTHPYIFDSAAYVARCRYSGTYTRRGKQRRVERVEAGACCCRCCCFRWIDCEFGICLCCQLLRKISLVAKTVLPRYSQHVVSGSCMLVRLQML